MKEYVRIDAAAAAILEAVDAAKREALLCAAEMETRHLLRASPPLSRNEIDRRAQAFTLAVADRANEILAERQRKPHNVVGNA